jgi:hypothetical protein
MSWSGDATVDDSKYGYKSILLPMEGLDSLASALGKTPMADIVVLDDGGDRINNFRVGVDKRKRL